jgi:hypothetical protein
VKVPAREVLAEILNWLDKFQQQDDPYISADDEAELLKANEIIHGVRKRACDREEDDYRARDASPQGV